MGKSKTRIVEITVRAEVTTDVSRDAIEGEIRKDAAPFIHSTRAGLIGAHGKEEEGVLSIRTLKQNPVTTIRWPNEEP